MQPDQKYNICLVCDFFYPRTGGVENHIFQLALCLIERGHKVIVFTHQYGKRSGVRYLTNGVKVYYCPFQTFIDQIIWPTFFSVFSLFRKVLIRESIQIVHTHQATSSLGHECLLHARTMGLKAMYTDHSLFGFSDAFSNNYLIDNFIIRACININKVIKFYLSDIDAAVSVSHTSRENLTLRASLNPYSIYVIPNAVDCQRFTPDPSKRWPLNTINIVVMSRLTFRKGVDLLVDVIPMICQQFPEVHFIIGGDGPKRCLLENMIEKFNLQNRVELLGSIQHKEVRNVLVRGHIFLNTSLTEAFCIAIVEAAAAGLFVVSTNVGGIREVLPPDMRLLAEPDSNDIFAKVCEAIPQAKNIQSFAFHERVKTMYNWKNVAQRHEIVYNTIMQKPQITLKERIKKYYSCGKFAGIILLCLVIVDIIFYIMLCLFTPAEKIEKTIDFPYKKYKANKEQFGDHNASLLKLNQ